MAWLTLLGRREQEVPFSSSCWTLANLEMGVEWKVEDDNKQLRRDEEHRISIEQATQGAAQLAFEIRVYGS